MLELARRFLQRRWFPPKWYAAVARGTELLARLLAMVQCHCRTILLGAGFRKALNTVASGAFAATLQEIFCYSEEGASTARGEMNRPAAFRQRPTGRDSHTCGRCTLPSNVLPTP